MGFFKKSLEYIFIKDKENNTCFVLDKKHVYKVNSIEAEKSIIRTVRWFYYFIIFDFLLSAFLIGDSLNDIGILIGAIALILLFLYYKFIFIKKLKTIVVFMDKIENPENLFPKLDFKQRLTKNAKKTSLPEAILLSLFSCVSLFVSIFLYINAVHMADFPISEVIIIIIGLFIGLIGLISYLPILFIKTRSRTEFPDNWYIKG